MKNLDREFLLKAIEKAKESVIKGGFPAGAILVKNGEIISEGISVGNLLNDPTSHGEMSAIRNACRKLETSDLSGCTLYASMQPCVMCFSAAMWGSIPKVIFACSKDKVSDDYYGGHYQISSINQDFIKPIMLTHLAELEDESLMVVKNWEDSHK